MTKQQTENVSRDGSMADPSKFRPSPTEFRCGEELEESGGSVGRSGVLFFCNLPRSEDYDDQNGGAKTTKSQRLTFSCRDRSSGVLEVQESAITNDEFEQTQNATAVDPFFFDPGYTLAGRTGFQVWSGTRLLIESLLFPLPDDNDQLVIIQREMNSREGKNILELGAGVGVVGTILAAATGSRVILTDLPTLVENSILPNLKRNRNESRSKDTDRKGNFSEPSWMRKASSNMKFEEEEDDIDLVFPMGDSGGWASIANIDWTAPLNDEVSSISSLDWIIASDCVWLISMLDSLLNTVANLFKLNPNARFLLSFQRRDAGDSTRFSSVSSIISSVRKRQWSIECLSWRHVRQEGEIEPKEVFVFQIATNTVA